MDIKPTITPTAASAAAKPPSADKAELSQDGQVSAPAFSQLLRGLKTGVTDGTDSQELTGLRVSVADDGVGLETLNLLSGALSIEGLVGQTQRLDIADADLALQDGSFLLAQQEAGLAPSLATGQGWGAQPHIAAGQNVATVAAGVQPALQAAVADNAQIASTVLARGSDAAESVLQATADNVLGESTGEGRVALQGAWQLDDAQSPLSPVLQRVIGQVEQWAAASAGGQPKANSRMEEGKSAESTGDFLAAGQGSGTRLTENAVKEAQHAQHAMFETHNEPAVQDMRFWLQGKQQRAEVMLEKDGQSVRVQVSVRGNEAHVTFKADQAQTRALLDASLGQLREMLEQQGMQLTGVSVQADAQGDQPASGQGPRNPWDAAPMQHGQVAVPVNAEALVVRNHRPLGLDLYA